MVTWRPGIKPDKLAQAGALTLAKMFNVQLTMLNVQGLLLKEESS
jgi:hypothetical protein